MTDDYEKPVITRHPDGTIASGRLLVSGGRSMGRAAVVEYLAGLTEEEFAAIVTEARGIGNLDAKALIEREFARSQPSVAR